MSDQWGPLDAADWRSTPAIVGRSATEADVAAGIAVFYVPSGSKPHSISLPACAVHHDAESGRATPVIVIQAEVAPDGGDVVLGVRPLDGGNMVCMLSEVVFLEAPDASFTG